MNYDGLVTEIVKALEANGVVVTGPLVSALLKVMKKAMDHGRIAGLETASECIQANRPDFVERARQIIARPHEDPV